MRDTRDVEYLFDGDEPICVGGVGADVKYVLSIPVDHSVAHFCIDSQIVILSLDVAYYRTDGSGFRDTHLIQL